MPLWDQELCWIMEQALPLEKRQLSDTIVLYCAGVACHLGWIGQKGCGPTSRNIGVVSVALMISDGLQLNVHDLSPSAGPSCPILRVSELGESVRGSDVDV